MISKNEVKYIQSLSDKKNRDREGMFVAEGPKLVNDLLANGLFSKIIFTTKNAADYSQYKTETKEITLQDLQRISQWETPNEVIGIFYKKKVSPFYFKNSLTLALDGIQDPGNLGTIIRTADWFGITQIIASPDTVDCYNSKVIQSTMGSIARVNMHYTDLTLVLADAGITVIGALLAGKNLYQLDALTEGIIVIGNESKGIRNEVLPLIGQAVTIPRFGKAESLNAAIATGIILSHFTRR